MLDLSERKALLCLARGTIEAYVRNTRIPDVDDSVVAEDKAFGGAFVTIRNKAELRGCMGTFHPLGSMAQTVCSVAKSAAQDPRFVNQRISAEELDRIDVQVSILSQTQRTHDPLSLKIGTHGILIQSPQGSGCFLPQVATELGWDAEQFLTHCCAGKANLAPDAWKQADTEVHLFTTECFGENEPDMQDT